MKNAMPRPITPELIAKCNEVYESNPMNQMLAAAASKTALGDVAFHGEAARKMEHTFSVDLHPTAVTSQKASGRCWIFAAMNVLREIVARNCNMERVELSENYVAFWDKFEKINYFLESIIDTADHEVGDRTLDWLLQGIGDGGQWDMIVSLVKKYGVAPISAMPETFQSSNTRSMNQLVNMKLREYAIELRTLIAAGKDPSDRKDEMLAEMYRALCICFGKPATVFDFEYVDKDKQYHVDRSLTPQAFFDKYVGKELEDYVSIINAPTNDKPYYRSYTVAYLGNVVEGQVRYLNVPMNDFKDLVVKQLKDGEAVWFGSDCGKYGDRTSGIWDIDSFLYGELLGGISLGLTKEQRLDYRDSAMNHAMVIMGVNFDKDGTPDRWKIENSWGDEPGNKGYFVMSAKWFDEFTYQAVINKKHLSAELLSHLEEEPIVLQPWDPMGSLA